MPRLSLLTVLLVALSGCYIPITRTHREPVPFDLSARIRDTMLDHEVRVTRLDGLSIVYPIGSQLGSTGAWGRGRAAGQRRPIYNVPLDSIAEVRVLRRELLLIPTILSTAAASSAAAIAITAAFLSLWT